MTTSFIEATSELPGRRARRRRSVAYWPIALILPGALASAALASRAGKLSSRVRASGLWALGGASALALARWQLLRFFIEKPTYVLESRIGKLEVRRYPAFVQAETILPGEDWDEALSEGFRRLKHYISAGNTGAEHIPMTAPVLSSPARRDELEMTSPVTARTSEGYTVAFLMPKDRDLSTLPAPRDARVSLRALPPRRVAALRHSGRVTGERLRVQESRLLSCVEQAGLIPISEPTFAAYDPPSTLPILRRLELWVQVA